MAVPKNDPFAGARAELEDAYQLGLKEGRVPDAELAALEKKYQNTKLLTFVEERSDDIRLWVTGHLAARKANAARKAATLARKPAPAAKKSAPGGKKGRTRTKVRTARRPAAPPPVRAKRAPVYA